MSKPRSHKQISERMRAASQGVQRYTSASFTNRLFAPARPRLRVSATPLPIRAWSAQGGETVERHPSATAGTPVREVQDRLVWGVAYILHEDAQATREKAPTEDRLDHDLFWIWLRPDRKVWLNQETTGNEAHRLLRVLMRHDPAFAGLVVADDSPGFPGETLCDIVDEKKSDIRAGLAFRP